MLSITRQMLSMSLDIQTAKYLKSDDNMYTILPNPYTPVISHPENGEHYRPHLSHKTHSAGGTSGYPSAQWHIHAPDDSLTIPMSAWKGIDIRKLCQGIHGYQRFQFMHSLQLFLGIGKCQHNPVSFPVLINIIQHWNPKPLINMRHNIQTDIGIPLNTVCHPWKSINCWYSGKSRLNTVL